MHSAAKGIRPSVPARRGRRRASARMPIAIRLREEVVNDLSAAADWYNDQRAGLGDEFVQAAFAAIDELAERPTWFPVVRKHVRRALMKRFPYAIYFKVERSAVTVFVVVHTARARTVWRKRLK